MQLTFSLPFLTPPNLQGTVLGLMKPGGLEIAAPGSPIHGKPLASFLGFG